MILDNNPFASPILSLRITGKDYVNGTIAVDDGTPDIVLWGQEGNNPNPYCKFMRMELEESIFAVYPEGKIFVHDEADLASMLIQFNYNQIYCELIGGEKYVWDIKATCYTNNAASDMDKTILEIQFTNKFYFAALEKDPCLGVDKTLQFPRVGNVLELMKLMLANVKTEIGSVSSMPVNRSIRSLEFKFVHLFNL